MGRLIVLSGPSCAGKGPLHTALKRFYPELASDLRMVVLYNSREPRPAEEDGIDYHFRPRTEIEALRGRDGFVVMDVRGDLQALDLNDLRETLKAHDAFFEGNPFVGGELLKVEDVGLVSAFLAPLSKEEILYLKAPQRKVDLQAFVTDVMRRKLLRRTQKQKGILSLKELQNIEKRCGSAYRELQDAWRFDHVIPNHDGEDSENWNAFYYPVADARKALMAFAALLRGETPEWAEKWDEGMV